MAHQENHKATFRRYLDAFNSGDLDAFDHLLTADYVDHSPGGPEDPAPGPDGLKPIVAHLRSESPALRFEEIDLIVEGDLLAAHLLVHGVRDQPLRQMQVERFREGRIAEHWRATGDEW